MSVAKHAKDIAEPEFGRAKKIHVWEHGDIYSKCHEIFINPNHLRTFNSILNYLTSSLNPVFGAIRKLVSIKTKKCISCFTDLENNGRYIAVGVNKCIKFSAKRYRTCSENETKLTKKTVKRFYSGDVGEAELRFLCETQKRRLTIIYVLMNGITCQSPFKVVLTGREILWDIILGYLDSILDAPTGIQNLCTIYGDVILDPNQLQHGYVYVALPFNEKFVDMDYMSFFTDWEDDRSKKKGLLSNIRRSSRKYGKDYFCKDVPVGDKKSYTVPCDCDPKCLENNESCTCIHTDAQNRGESEYDYGLQSEYDDTQTVCMDKNQAVIPGSEICIYINIDEYGKHTQICPAVCPGVQRTHNIVQCMPVQTPAGAIDKDKKTTDKTQTDASISNPYNKHQQNSARNKGDNKKVNKSYLNEDSKQNADNTEYISVSVIVSKSSKAVGKSETEQNCTNIILTKTCEARTLCPNIALSGSFSKKVGVITDIVNNVINETYGRLTQTENNLRNGVTDKGKIPIMNRGDADNTTKGYDGVVNTGINRNEDNKSAFKLNDNKVSERPNTPYGGKCIRIQNKTYINVSDPAEAGRDQAENTVTFCDKCTSSPHIPSCPYATKVPQIDEYKCCVCPISTMNTAISERKSNDANKTGVSSRSTKSSHKTVRDKSVHSPKTASVRKNTVPKEESKVSKHASQVSKQSKNLETQTQNITRISLEMQTDNAKEHNKSVQNSMSVDSLSEEVTRKDEGRNQALPTQKENSKDAVAITVNISKVNGPETTEENGGGKVNDVYSSKIVVDGNFTEKYDDVKSILSDIIGATFQKLMIADSNVENDDRKIADSDKSRDVPYGAPMLGNDPNIATDSAEKRNASSEKSKLSKDFKSQTSKTSFDKISENKNNINITVVPPRVCSPVVHMQELGLCENYKSTRRTPHNKTGMLTDVYCMCDTFRKQGNDILNGRESRKSERSNQGSLNRKSKDTKDNTNRSFQNGKDFRGNKKSNGSEVAKDERDKQSSILLNKKSKTSESVHSQTRKNEKLIGVISFTKSTDTEDIAEQSKKNVKQSSASSNRSRGQSQPRNTERRSQVSTARKNNENNNGSAQRQSRDPGSAQNSRSKSRKREKSGDFYTKRRESEISIDSIDDNQCCCICVCSPNYTLKVNGAGN